MLFKVRKFICLVFITILIPITFISCDNVKLSSDIDIHFNGDINTTIRLDYNETVSKITGNDLFSILLGDDASNFSINKYTSEDRYIEEINIDTNIIKFISNKKDIVVNENPSNFFDYNITNDSGFFVNTYTFKLSLNEDIMNIINSLIKNELNNNLNLYLNSSISSLISGGVSNGITKYIASLPYDLTLSTPVDIIDSNATEQINSRTLKWSYLLGDLDENTELMVSFKMPNIVNISIISILVLILLIIVIISIVKRKKKLFNR